MSGKNKSEKSTCGPLDRRVVVYVDIGTMGNHHLRRSAIYIFVVYCVSYLAKQSVKTTQTKVHCFENRLFQSEMAVLAKTSGANLSVH